MHCYHAYHHAIFSDIELPLPPSEVTELGFRFQLLNDAALDREPDQWFHHHLVAGVPWLALGKYRSGDYHLRFHGLADFVITSNTKQIYCYALPGVPTNTVKHLLLDQVLPLLLSWRGNLVLHASAVQVADRLLVFFGNSGAGKSTLALQFHLLGFPILTDDCLLLQRQGNAFAGVPSYPGLRLRPDSIELLSGTKMELSPVAHYNTKQRISSLTHVETFAADPLPLHRGYLLAPHSANVSPDGIEIVPVSKRDAVMKLVESSFRLDLTDRERLTTELDSLVALADSLELFELYYPHNYHLLPSVCEHILLDAGHTTL